MGAEEHNIDELFKQAFESYEPNVDQSLWENVSKEIGNNLSAGVSTASVSTSISSLTILSIAVVCGILGAGIALLVQNFDSNNEKDQQNEQIEIKSHNPTEINVQSSNSKDLIFTLSEPVDKNDPVLIKSESDKNKYELQVENIEKPVVDNERKTDNINIQKPSSIVQLYLTPEGKHIKMTTGKILRASKKKNLMKLFR